MRLGWQPRSAVNAVWALLLVGACGGKAAAPGEPALCRITTSIAVNKPLEDRTLPAPFWFSLLVRGYQSTGAIARPTRDCEGQLVSWEADACAADAQLTPLESEPLNDGDLVVSHLGEGRRLVWVQTDHFANGEAVGPVALAVFDPRGVSVTTLGVLRAFGARAQLRLEALGDGEVLVAEGEACGDERDARTCVRGIRVVPVGKRRFVALDVSDPSGRCVGRAFFPLRADGTLGEGARRKSYRIQSSVNFAPDALTVQEQLTISQASSDAGSADGTASAVARMTAERHIRLAGGRLVSDEPSLLDRWATQERARHPAGAE
jgi:hypothetical protein